MTLFNVIPYLLMQAALLAIFTLPVFSFIDEKETRGRVSNLDGLRGFLALAVFTHHALLYFFYITMGAWGYGIQGHFLYGSLGGLGVQLFFMITGFLFWGKLVDANRAPNWISLYVGRVFRIGPLYLAAVLWMTLIIFSRCGFKLNSSVAELAGAMAHWLALGIDASQPPINNWPWTPFVLLGVTWSIQYEWFFYFSLLVLAPFAGRRLRLAFPSVALIVGYLLIATHDHPLWAIPACFASGALAATLVREKWMPTLPDPFASIAAIVVLTASLFYDEGSQLVPIVLKGVFFYLVCSSATLFGLLRLKASVRLGHISYGIYLLQGIPLALVFDYPAIKAWATQTPLHYWSAITGIALLLCLCAAIGHVLIERPGIAAGRVVARRTTLLAETLLRRFVRYVDARLGDGSGQPVGGPPQALPPQAPAFADSRLDAPEPGADLNQARP